MHALTDMLGLFVLLASSGRYTILGECIPTLYRQVDQSNLFLASCTFSQGSASRLCILTIRPDVVCFYDWIISFVDS
jgi:hypothetical protein